MPFVNSVYGCVSQLEINPALFELFVFVCVEPEQLSRTMATAGLHFLERNEQAKAQNLFSEVPFIQLCSQYRFVEMLELRQRELGGQQLEAYRLIAHLAFQASQSRRENFSVIECELRDLGDRE